MLIEALQWPRHTNAHEWDKAMEQPQTAETMRAMVLEVFGMTGGVASLQGPLAEYAAVDADLLAPKPTNFSMREAAAFGLAIITAWEGLVDRARLDAGETLLVHGGAGGVGNMCVQLGVALGGTTFATGSQRDLPFIAASGATPIDYRARPIDEYVAEATAGPGSTSSTTPSAET